jgi:transposase
MAVIGDGLSVSQVAENVGVSRQTLHSWLARYEAEGLEGLVDGSHRPVSCPHQMPAVVEAALLELRRSRPYWGPRRLVFELAKRRVVPVRSASTAYRAPVRAGMIDPSLPGQASALVPSASANPPTMSICHSSIAALRSQRFHLRERRSRKGLVGVADRRERHVVLVFAQLGACGVTHHDFADTCEGDFVEARADGS